MAGNAEKAGSSLKRRSPDEVRVVRASGNEINFGEEIVMGDNSTAASSVIPFDFRGHSVRVVTIDGEPWFVAADVCRVLDVTNTTQAMQALDEDERSMFNIGRQGQANVVNESGLYTLILRCRDAVNKGSKPHAFRKWVTSEVLPSIRKHGRFESSQSQMATLIGTVIGSDGEHVLDQVIDQKANALPAALRRSFKHTMKSRLRTRFSVQKTALIPAEELANACNFVAAYVYEGELLPKREQVQIVGSPLKRYLVAFDHKGEQVVEEVPDDACVLSTRDLIQGMVMSPGDIPVSTPDMFEFLMAAVVNLRGRFEYMARRARA
ncbi:BRO-N domain-containing protein [Pseudomonas asiatica]|uniref:BRO-N domain-containing protein n=1 Tax=Pseudomonas asiatica TaxID=2219225 RepID=UPI0025A4001C|nr:Bro-N domain-containing protein [Pseudomonas asiatica]WJN52136.1 Bro-N domain-containing protein [Pseudomonas asiatica]